MRPNLTCAGESTEQWFHRKADLGPWQADQWAAEETVLQRHLVSHILNASQNA